MRFLVSKTRVAPLKCQTIPRLELLSALLLSRLVQSVTDSLGAELNLDPPHCYTDSKVALYWLWGENRVWKQFVQHRVTEIRSLIPGSCWSHCLGIDNPADLPSRGVTPADLEDNDLWINGPQWLGSPSESDHTLEEPMPAEYAVELRAEDRPATVSLIVTKDSVDISQLIDCQKYSSMLKLLQVTTYLLRFVANLKNKTPSKASNSSYQAQAEVLWIKAAQKQFVTDGNFEKTKQPLPR